MKGFLQVDALHQLYFERHGNLNGPTILFIHGGPGLESSSNDLEFFDLSQQNVVLYDQRGCGKSKPKGYLYQNTTAHLIDDIIKLLNYLKIKEVFLFGGSWGSTLSLLFGIQHSGRVRGMILRGLFTATLKERKHLEIDGIKTKQPQIWKRFISLVPSEHQSNPSTYYFKQILEGDLNTRKKYAYEWQFYIMSILNPNKSESETDQYLQTYDYINRSKIFAHYAIHDFFIPINYINDHLKLLSNIPIHLIHGKSDPVTLPKFAKTFNEKNPNVVLHLTEGEHSPRNPKILNALKEVISLYA